VTFIS